MPPLQTDTWSEVLDKIKATVGDQRFSLWFQNIRPLSLQGEVVRLGVPNLFVQDWLETNFKDVLRTSLADTLGNAPNIVFVIDAELFQASRKRELQASAEIVAEASSADRKSASPAPNIRPDFTIKNFVVGSCNKLLYACALEIIENPSCPFYPLFIHGLSGLGKTHLLQAIWHELRARDDGRTAEYLSAETFTNQYIYAIRNNRLDAFRHRFRNAEVLLIDDVHFINNKRGVQEELLHTFEALDSRRRRLVLASDVHPKMLMQIKETLINRFASGMVVGIGQPDFTTRVAILKAKLRQQRRRVPEEVLRYIARGFEGSVRDLTGAVTSVLAYAALTGEKIDIGLARTALSKLGRPPQSPLTAIENVEKVVARHYGLKPSQLRARRQTRATRLPRRICMALARECTSFSCREIAQHFNAANHSTVVFACKRTAEQRRKDPRLNELVAAMAAEIKKA